MLHGWKGLLKMKNKLQGFTLLRNIAAFQVLYGHLVMHYHLEQWEINGIPVFTRLLSPFMGVPVFFALSGYFLWKSLSIKRMTACDFGYRRFIRIYPELWIVVVTTAITILVLYYSNVSMAPFSAWIFTQSTVMQFWTPSCLRDYGVGCPNGSLWTITVFVQFYIVVYILHKILHDRQKNTWGGVLLVSVLLNVVPGLFKDAIPEIIYKLYQQTVFPYLAIFMFAAFIAEYEDVFRKLLENKRLCFALYIVLVIGLPFDFNGAGYAVLKSALVAIFAITFGNAVNCSFLKKDISYEIYLVHMPIANIFVELLEKQSSWIFLATVFLTYLVAYVLYQLNTKIVRVLERKK